MITLLVLATGAAMTPLIRLMLAGFECLSVGAVILRLIDAARGPRLADIAAQRRERWEAAHPVRSDDQDEQDEQDDDD